MNFHINKKGLPVECKNDPNECKLGLTNEHWENIEEAQRAANRLMSTQFSLFPDVHYTNAVVPDKEVVRILSESYSEIYAASKFVQGIGNPIICLGKNNEGESVYHCVYIQDNLYYDINGLVALDKEKLESFIKDKYDINTYWAYVEEEQSIKMIENLLKLDLQSEGFRKRFAKYIQLEHKSAKENSDKKVALEFILKEL